jgi:macrolide transport system ATP-binding/permease protein
MVIQVQDLSRAFGSVTVLQSVSLIINAGERVGLVGINGAGKTTLLRILAGVERADGGSIRVAPGARLGYLPQSVPDLADKTIDDLIHAAVGDLRDLETQLHQMEAALETAQGAELQALLDDYGTLVADFQDRGGYDLDYRIDAVLAGLGLADLPRNRAVATLSGGEKARVSLAALLLQAPDVLLLDEPTNHLDFAAAGWLEDYLAAYRGAVLVVSHDRQFLNRTVQVICEIDEHQHDLRRYVGDYDAYAAAKRAERTQWEEDFARQQDEIKALRKRIRESARQVAHNRMPKDGDKFIYNFKGENVQSAISRNVRAAEVQLARIEADPIPKPPKPLRFTPRFNAVPLRSDAVLRAQGLSKHYGARQIVADVSFELDATARMVIVAPNGAGKTTLLRLLLGQEAADAGTARFVEAARVGYLPQDPALPDPQQTVLDAFGAGRVGLPEQFIAGLIGYGFFRLEDMAKRVGQLSLGQRRKLELARLMADQPNMLILDEPTNYLSLDVLEAFEAAIHDFQGPVLAVSHDRWFIARFGGVVWDLLEGRLVRRA